MLELLRVEPGRIAPGWADVPESAGGSPRLYVARGCRNLIAQLQSAPVATEGWGAGVMVDPDWESDHGHAHAALRYGAMSWPSPSTEPAVPWNPPVELLRRCEARMKRDLDLDDDLVS